MEDIRKPQELAEFLEKEHNVAMWRRSWVTPEALSPTKKKEYHYEYPKMSSKDILGKGNGRGYTNQPKNYPDAYMAISIYLKYVPRLYVIDFDTKSKCNDVNEFWDLCRSYETIQFNTVKGTHFYFYIDDVPEYSCSTKIQESEDYGDVDIVGKKKDGMFNITERADNPVVKLDDGGYAKEIKTIPWSDISCYINPGRMNASPPSKEDKKINKSVNLTAKAINGDKSQLEEEKFVAYLERLDKVKRFHYEDWFKVGCICYNNWDDKDQGFSVWFSWTKSDPNFKEEHSQRTMDWCADKWKTIGKYDGKLACWKTLRGMANIDDPTLNMYQELYDTAGENGVVDYMNGFMFFCRETSEIIYMDPEDDTQYMRHACKKPTDLISNFRKFQFYITFGEPPKKKRVNPFNVWMDSIRQLQVCRIVFDPHPDCPSNCFNLWRGFDVEEADVETMSLASANVECQALLQHLMTIWCHGNQEHYHYLMSWFAFLLQYPWKKVGVMLVAKSNEGAGKGIVFDFMRHILGGQLYAQINSISQIVNPKENGILEGRLLINCDEAHWGGNIKDANMLKMIITEEEIYIRELYRKAYKVKNTTALCMSSNELRATSAREGDRRHFGLELSNKWAGKQKTPGHANYFSAISGMKHSGIKREKYMAFAKVLYEWDLTNFNVRNPPNTDFIDEQMAMNWTAGVKWWFNILKSGLFSIGAKHKQPKFDANGDKTEFNDRILEWGYIAKDKHNGLKKVKTTYEPTGELITLTLGGINMIGGGGSSSSGSFRAKWRSMLKDCGREDAPLHIPIPKSYLYASNWNTSDQEIDDKRIRGERRSKLTYHNNSGHKAQTRRPQLHIAYNTEPGKKKDTDHHNAYNNDRNGAIWWATHDNDNGDDVLCELDAHTAWWYEKQNWTLGKWRKVGGPQSFPRNDDKFPIFSRIETADVSSCGNKSVKLNDIKLLDKYISHWEKKIETAEEFLDYEDGDAHTAVYPLLSKTDWKDSSCVGCFEEGEKVPTNCQYYEHKNIVEYHYYDKDWVFEMYCKNEGLGYGGSNPDVGMFWKEISSCMGGGVETGGCYEYKRKRVHNSSGAQVRRQLLVVPTLDTCRRHFEKWCGRPVRWVEEGCTDSISDGTFEDEHLYIEGEDDDGSLAPSYL
jgi:hypothetical protein